MIKFVEKFLKSTEIVKNKSVVVGFSGGPDSTALLYLFYKYQKDLNLTIKAAHFNHQWRDSSFIDEEFCKEFCAQLKIPLIIGYAQDYSYKKVGSKEAQAREQRLTFFSQFKDSYIALAHTLDDQLENFFIRLIRGSSLEGLTGMKESTTIKSIEFIRPLLNCSKQEIIEFCDLNNLKFITDPTNQDLNFLRNRIRQILIPTLNECDTRASGNILKFIQQLNSAQSFINKTLEEKNIITHKSLNIKKWLLEDKFLKQEAIKHWLIINQYPGDISQSLIKEVSKFCQSEHGGKHTIKENFVIIKKNKILIVNRQNI